MNSQIMFVITAAMLVAAFVAVAPLAIAEAADNNGVPNQKNFGQCKQEKNRQACESNKDKFTGSN